ncbi:hypothetical protein [Roseateles sp.]|uniref:hypothetical protein n=1 Tax=Roseateles sp. TaxID=1971397 RepID=UPI0032664D6D
MSRLALICAALLASVLAGCGTPSQPLPMAITQAEALQVRGWVPESLQRQVALAPVQGGEATGRWWGSRVSAVTLQQALDESLYAVGMRPASPEPAARFELQAELLQLQQPLVPVMGVTVGTAVRYTLVDKASGKIVYQRRIANTEEASLGDALVSPSERLRIANERALRANISLLLRDLVTLRP